MTSNKLEEAVLLYSPRLPACQALLNNVNFKMLVHKLPLKMLIIDDERTKHFLLKANIRTVPMLLLNMGDDVLEVKTGNNIIKVLEDLTRLPQLHETHEQTSQNNQVAQRRLREASDFDDQIPNDNNQQLFKAQVIYKTATVSISYINCDKFMSQDNAFDLTIVNETCRKVHFETENYITVNVTNMPSLKKIIPVLLNIYEQKKKLNVLAVSKSKRLADIITAICMFFIHHHNLDDIQSSTSISKKTLSDLTTEYEDVL
jgi:hypothetical protein